MTTISERAGTELFKLAHDDFEDTYQAYVSGEVDEEQVIKSEEALRLAGRLR
jgi:hypothetical protein